MPLESSTLQTRRWPRVRPHYGGAPRSGPHTLRSYTPYQREGQSSTSSPRPSAAICNSMANRPSHCVELTQRRSIALCCRHRYGRVGRDGMAYEALEEPTWQMANQAPNRSDSPSRVCTPKPSFAMLFADMNFSVSALQIPHDAQTETSQCKLWYTIEELRRLLDKQAIMHVTHPG